MKIEGIKCLYTLKEIFSLVITNRKMNIIIYNKELQEKIGIDIEDYKQKSGKYKIGKRVGKRIGKGAEYTQSKNKLIFEGEYLNGKRNGKGKEYSENGEIKFEGKYLNGLKNGKGIEYYFKKYFYQKKEIKFEGQYLNGLRNGKGKEYYKDEYLKFEGKYLNGLRNGKGKEYKIYKFFDYDYNYANDYYEYDAYFSKLSFEGKYLNGKRNGKGKEYYKNGKLKFKGEYLNGLKIGKGKEYYEKIFWERKNGGIKFEGEYLNGLKNGKGKEYYENGEIKFEGEYLNGLKNGKWNEYYKNGEIKFEGEYLNGKRWDGKIYKYNYKIKECTPFLGFNYFEIKNGKGKIKDYYANGEIKFEGQYLNGLKNGNGNEYYKPKDCETNRCDYANNNNNISYKGKFEYEGEDLNDDYDDDDDYDYYDNYDNYDDYDDDDDYNNRNIKYKGEYLNGLRNGKGKLYDRSGKLIFEGEYFKGKRKKWIWLLW